MLLPLVSSIEFTEINSVVIESITEFWISMGNSYSVSSLSSMKLMISFSCALILFSVIKDNALIREEFLKV